ncbi:MAG: hypothetical protein FJ146_16435 [Deltaproteobacteria bacterium]|nr:hypothetical protein [Deltaproteobacteria bacterium]
MSTKYTHHLGLLTAALPAAVLLLFALWPRTHQDTVPKGIEKSYIYDSNIENVDDILAVPASEWGTSNPWQIPRVDSKLINHWVHVKLPAVTFDTDFAAFTYFPYYRTVAFYLIEGGKIVDSRVTGFDANSGSTDWQSPLYHFKFALSIKPRDLYVRLTGDGRITSELNIVSASRFAQEEKEHNLIMFCVSGFNILLLTYCFGMIFTTKSVEYVYQFITQICNLGITYFICGINDIVPFHIHLSLPYAAKLSLFLYALSFTAMLAVLKFHVYQDVRNKYERYYLYISAAHIAVALLSLILNYFASFFVMYAVGSITWMWLKQTHGKQVNVASSSLIYVTYLTTLVCVNIYVFTVLEIITPSAFTQNCATIGLVFLHIGVNINTGKRLQLLESRYARMRRALSADHSVTMLNGLLSQTYFESVNTTTAEVAVMFIDVVSFTRISEQRQPQVVFDALSRNLNEIVAIIESRGGAVDRSLGDGVLCFFSANSETTEMKHIEKAFEAASAIQVHIVKKTIGDPTAVIMPVRIGIHNTNVLIGNLGESGHLDLTMIGAGVNFASRLEAACSPFKITVSDEFYQALCMRGIDVSRFHEINIAIKHQNKLTRAFEFNPCLDMSDALQAAIKLFFTQIGAEKSDSVYAIKDDTWIKIVNDTDEFDVINFSLHGFKARSKKLYGRKTQLQLSLITSNRELSQKLSANLIGSITVEVRWSQAEGSTYVHGLKIIGASMRRKVYLLDLLTNHIDVGSMTTSYEIEVDHAS